MLAWHHTPQNNLRMPDAGNGRVRVDFTIVNDEKADSSYAKNMAATMGFYIGFPAD